MRNLNTKLLSGFVAFVCMSYAYIEVAHASGDLNALQEFVRSIWGKIAIYIAIALGLGAFLYIKLSRKLAEAKAVNDLRFMSKHSTLFDWARVRPRLIDCFYRYHAPWRPDEDEAANVWMSETYWRDFRSSFLERIEQEGLVNVSNIKAIKEVKPIFFAHRNVGGKDEGSRLVVVITAKLRNYLAALSTGDLIEGIKEYHETNTIWSFEIVDGNWVITNVEDITASDKYLKMVGDLPKIEETLLKPVKIMTAAE